MHVWNALRGWAQRLYRKADIVLITEVRHGPHLRFLARPDISGLKHFALWQEQFFTNVGILSRFPLSEVRPLAVDRNYFLAAKADVEGTSHQLIVAHWDLGLFTSSPAAAAEQMVDIVRQAVAGIRRRGPERPLRPWARRHSRHRALRVRHIGDRDVGHVHRRRAGAALLQQSAHRLHLLQGRLRTREFHACLDAQPSDHPFVIVTFERAA